MKEYKIANFVAVKKNEVGPFETQDFRILLEVEDNSYKPILFLQGNEDLLKEFNVNIDISKTESLEEKTQEEAVDKFLRLYQKNDRIRQK